KNIKRMAEKAEKSGVVFRPHFKTHQSAEVGEFFKDAGVKSITVSSVDMAEYFADNGWNDITVAFPVNIREIGKINELAAKIDLNLLVESVRTVNYLKTNLKSKTRVWIKIDIGYNRTGLDFSDTSKILDVVRGINECDNLILEGLLTHTGHSYHAKSEDEIRNLFAETVERLNNVKERLAGEGFKDIKISVGDTPGCSVVETFENVDEIRPGNFVFYDVTQVFLRSCSFKNIGVAVACPVVAKHTERNEIVIYGGAVHLSKEFIEDHTGNRIFGLVALESDPKWKPLMRTYVSSLSQEHGIIKTDEQTFNKIHIGDLVLVLPVHSCLTVDLLLNK
ncbi:alanine racemase, partial [candidate division KSB1 bacterium]